MGADDGEVWGFMQAELAELRRRVAVLTEERDAAKRREQIADEARQIVGRWFNEQTARVAVLEAGLRDASAALAVAARHAETTGAAPIIVSVARDAHHAARALLQSEPGSAGGVPAAAPEPPPPLNVLAALRAAPLLYSDDPADQEAFIEAIHEAEVCSMCGSTDRAKRRNLRGPIGGNLSQCRDAWHDGETPL